MGAGKSAILIVRASLGEKSQKLVMKPAIDTRTTGTVKSRNGSCLECDVVFGSDESMLDIFRPIKDKLGKEILFVYIDEGQFLTKEQVDDLLFISHRHKVMIEVYGLLNNFKGEMFDGSKRLVEVADEIEEIPAYDSWGLRTKQNARLVDGKQVKEGEEVVIGMEVYEAMSTDQFFYEEWKKKEEKF